MIKKEGGFFQLSEQFFGHFLVCKTNLIIRMNNYSLQVTKDHHGLENEEVGIISGALDMKTKTVRDVMTKLDCVFMLPVDAVLNFDTMAEIEYHGKE